VPTARRFVRTALEDLDLLPAYEAAEMLVSEVVTNAVLHARTELTVEVVRHGDMVRVSVTDLSPVIPRMRAYATDSSTGRGLRLIATLAVAWGVDRTAAGKRVWFDVPTVGDALKEVEPWSDDADLDQVLASFDDVDPAADLSPAPTALFGRPVALRWRAAA